MTEDGDRYDIDNQNIVSGNGHVDTQIGVYSVYHDATIYTVDKGDRPERKQEVALAYLTGGVPRHAEELLAELVFNGDPSTERAYYYVLSVLSERGFADLTSRLVSGIRDARKICDSLPQDRWKQALHVVWQILDHVRSDDGGASFAAVGAFGRLPAERQDEITTHLAMLVDGLVEQQLNAERKHEVGAERFSRDRVLRARLFFEPDPAEPVRYQPRMLLGETGDRRPVIVGGLLALVSFIGLFFGPVTFSLVAGVLLVVAGCAVLGRYGIEHTAHLLNVALRRDTEKAENEPAGPTAVDKLVDRCFREARPEYAAEWSRYAAGYRTRLKQRFNAQLRFDDPDQVKKHKWLLDWHARRVAVQWPHHDRYGQPEPTAPGGARLWQAAGVLVAVAGVLLLLFGAQRWQAIPLLVGGWFAVPGLVEVVAAGRAALLPLKEANEVFDEEMAEFDRWRRELRDRPTDSEMARWLALDKAHLKAEALRAGNITERDLVSHVVINQWKPGGRLGRVHHGPPRYTDYKVTVILLTTHGVRASQGYLDFLTGEIKDTSWDTFGYDRIASASLRVQEKAAYKRPGKVRNRLFTLRLLNNHEIITVDERLDIEDDTKAADESELERLAAATSGMDAALPVLEAVAHQGSAWITLERDRRTLWSRTWST
ncbi:hypothetical protein [Actinokineospora cianjurensis]|uniref:Uncharacterized protein n=1 Tax=Actinokineospora cianjurensis TaxID=585224 RepID=A0A421B5E7_9PSEU|nr:hypothetical protein [Actinokineospora cianjurensis]RLK59607.1 hypothetical protein CLV68_0088 [Actinokineospora cianjurensis]